MDKSKEILEILSRADKENIDESGPTDLQREILLDVIDAAVEIFQAIKDINEMADASHRHARYFLDIQDDAKTMIKLLPEIRSNLESLEKSLDDLVRL